MENKKVVRYEELSIGLKRKVTLKYLGNKEKSLYKIKQGDKEVSAIQIWHQDADYIVLISQEVLLLLEWDSLNELEQEDEIGSYYNLGFNDDNTDDMGMLFV